MAASASMLIDPYETSALQHRCRLTHVHTQYLEGESDAFPCMSYTIANLLLSLEHYEERETL